MNFTKIPLHKPESTESCIEASVQKLTENEKILLFARKLIYLVFKLFCKKHEILVIYHRVFSSH